jgi:hypothetical protein
MMTLRRRVQATGTEAVGYGHTRELSAVQQLTGGGPLEGQPFATIWERLQAANAAGYIEGGLVPKFVLPGDPAVGARLTWRFRGQPRVEGSVDSVFSIDLPGSKKTDRAFGSADLIGAHFEPAKVSGGKAGEHVSGTGVVVPSGSAPAHLVVTPDPVLRQLLEGWGFDRNRIEQLFRDYARTTR